MAKETSLFKNDKYEILFRVGSDKEVKQGYKPHTLLLIKDTDNIKNKALLRIEYKNNDFLIPQASFLKWYLPNYILDELKNSIEIYNKALE